MPKWTPQQQQAIDARNNTLLVSAAAGSGKTAVLVERIVQLIREGWKVDRMLIVTFTKAAAAEMRQRLSKRLTREAVADPEGMGRALDDLESTEISTIHAFCQKVLRNNFQAVGIDPMVRACDEQLRQNLFAEAWLDAFNQLIEEGEDPAFLDLANAWDEKSLRDMTDQLYDFLMSLPEPMDWLDRAVAQIDRPPYDRHPWYRLLLRHARLEIEGIGDILQAMRSMLDEPDAVDNRMDTWQSDLLAYHALLSVDWNHADSLLSALADFTLVKAKPARNTTDAQKEWLARYKKQRDRIAEVIERTQKRLTLDEDRLTREFGGMQHMMTGLSSLTKRTHAQFLAKKAEKHVIDFSDMEQFTLQILSDLASRAQMQGEYDHIFVDECQDVSQVQDAILQSIHNEHNCMFMVGDVKQSIYRFRKADPTLFLHRMRHFSDAEDAPCRRIFLQKNFRSRNNVLEATNQVFRVAMRPTVTELSYEKEDELICGRETENDPPVEVYLLDISPGEDGEAVKSLDAEAAVVVDRIRELLNETFDDGSGPRNYAYRDMVILLSAASNTAPRLVELLTAQGIPVYYDGAASFYALPEIQTMTALLTAIDNPMQDVPLLAALKTPPFRFTEDELGQVRTCKTGRNVPFYEAFAACCEGDSPLAEKCNLARKGLMDWRFMAEGRRLSSMVWAVIEGSGYYAASGSLPKGELRQANLRMLYQQVVEFEQNGGTTLHDFLELIQQQAMADDRSSAKMLGEGENLVRIMTMHKSKGLEFPVVFCMQMSGRLHKAFRGELLMHPSLGVAMPYVNAELRVKRKTLADEAFKVQRELDEKAERARLLYVAMTRARERLILVGCCKGNERDVWQMPDSDYQVWLAGSMTDWIMQGVYSQHIHNLSTDYPQGATPWKIRFWSEIPSLAVDNPVDKTGPKTYLRYLEETPSELDDPTDPIARWDVPEEETSPVLKTSVSALARKDVQHDPMPLSDEEETPEDKRTAEEVTTQMKLSELPARPAFLEEKQMTGAEWGTLMHKALSQLPLDALRGAANMGLAVRQAVHALVEQDRFTPQDLMLLNMKGLTRFYESDLGQRMLQSPVVRREWSFNLALGNDDGTLLQGVIDCCFQEEGGWVLVDYKTDRIEDEDAFTARYALQLGWYARALETITGLPVREKWLYAIGLGKAFSVS